MEVQDLVIAVQQIMSKKGGMRWVINRAMSGADKDRGVRLCAIGTLAYGAP